MKYLPQSNGPFFKLPFFEPHEIERIATDDLRGQSLLPEQPREIDVDSLVQKLFGFAPTYTDPGEGVLGYIRFGLLRPEVIILHESLADLEAGPTTERRRRSTLAHEIGHGRLHAGLYTELMQARRAGHGTERVRNPSAPNHFLCRGADVRDAEAPALSGMPSWERRLEWQANRYMAAVLTPARLMRAAVLELRGLPADDDASRLSLDAGAVAALAPEISERFNVSRQLAAFRLAELFPPAGPQGELFLAAGPLASSR